MDLWCVLKPCFLIVFICIILFILINNKSLFNDKEQEHKGYILDDSFFAELEKYASMENKIKELETKLQELNKK